MTPSPGCHAEPWSPPTPPLDRSGGHAAPPFSLSGLDVTRAQTHRHGVGGEGVADGTSPLENKWTVLLRVETDRRRRLGWQSTGEHVRGRSAGLAWGQGRGRRVRVPKVSPGPSPLRGGRGHLLRPCSRDDQVFMPSMLCRPRPSRGDQRTLEGASREDGRGRLSARRALVPGGGRGGLGTRRGAGGGVSQDSRGCPQRAGAASYERGYSVGGHGAAGVSCAARRAAWSRGGAGAPGGAAAAHAAPRAPRPPLHAPAAVAARPPRSDHFIPSALAGVRGVRGWGASSAPVLPAPCT